MAGDALTASTGLYLDDLNKIRVLEPEIAAETETLKVLKIQLNPALTDIKRLTFFFIVSGLLLLLTKEIKEIYYLKGPLISIYYRRNSIGGGSIRAGLNCIED